MKIFQLRGLLAVAAIVIFAVSSASITAIAIESETSEIKTISVTSNEILQSGGIPADTDSYFNTVGLEEETRDDILYRLILEGLNGVSDSISLSPVTEAGFEAYNFNVDADKNAVNEVFSLVINRNPNLFYVNNSYSLSAYSNGEVVSINPKYLYVGDELVAACDEYESLIEDVCAAVPTETSDYETILFLNDYFAANYCYDERVYDESTVADANFDAYSFLKEKTAVCQGYTLAMMAVMDKFNIECEAATSRKMNHTWNFVKLDENWYHVDVTHNDPTPDIPGRVMHRKFLRSDAGMTSVGAYGWNALYECSDTSYDEAANGLNTVAPFVKLGDDWYTTAYYNYSGRLYKLPTSDIRELYRLAASGEEIGTCVFELGRWTAANGGHYPSAYSYPFVFDDFMLFNSPNALYVRDVWDVVTQAENFDLAAGTNIYGLNIDGDTMRYMFADSPNKDDIDSATSTEAVLAVEFYYDYDGVCLGKALACDGKSITEVPQDPVRDDDGVNSYVFAGWKKNGHSYTATYNEEPLADFTIVDGTLMKCSLNIEKVAVPNGVEMIGKNAFADNDKIRYIVLPSTVTRVDGGAFDGVSATVYLTADCAAVRDILSAAGVSYKFVGDIDGNGAVNIADAAALANRLAGGSESFDKICADINADDAVTLADLSKLIKIFLNEYSA